MALYDNIDLIGATIAGNGERMVATIASLRMRSPLLGAQGA